MVKILKPPETKQDRRSDEEQQMGKIVGLRDRISEPELGAPLLFGIPGLGGKNQSDLIAQDRTSILGGPHTISQSIPKYACIRMFRKPTILGPRNMRISIRQLVRQARCRLADDRKLVSSSTTKKI